MTPLRQRMIDDMRLRNFSPYTQKAYLFAVEKFTRHFGRSPEKISREEIRQYLIHLIHERKVAWSTYNIARCGLRFVYEVTLGQTGALQGLPCPKEPKRLPVVLTFDEVAQFFDACESQKYLTVFLCAHPLQLPQGLKTTLTIDRHVAVNSCLGNPAQACGLRVDQSLADEPQNLHPLLHARMGMLKTLFV